MRGLKALAAAVMLAWAGAAAAQDAAAPLARTTAGQLRGLRQGEVEAFLGVPYAKPPVGPLRWRPPEPAPAWSGTRDAARFSAGCVQAEPRAFGPYTAEFLTAPPFSEDCLYLNVWTPARRAATLPVLVWIHGGGFDSGAGSIPIYDGARLAAKGAVVVTINYRLGVFGFLAHPELSRESPQQVSGDYGLLDMIAALQWVRANIAAFGGDPAKVTIAGQSAGAAAVNALLLSPPAHGLFRQVIAESGSGMGAEMPRLAEAEAQGAALARDAGAQDLAALRALPAERLVALTHTAFDPAAKAPPPLRYRPVIDGVVLPADPQDGAARPQTQAPLITGFNTDEGRMSPHAPSPAEFEAMVRARYAPMAERFLALYPHADAASVARAADEIARDRYMASLVIWADARSRAGQRLFTYAFDHAYPVPRSEVFRAFHTAEVPYVFGALDAPGRSFTAQDRSVSEQIQSRWLAFMRVGDPNDAGQPHWSPFQPGETRVMELGDRTGPTPAVSSPERLQAFRDFVAGGGKLSLF